MHDAISITLICIHFEYSPASLSSGVYSGQTCCVGAQTKLRRPIRQLSLILIYNFYNSKLKMAGAPIAGASIATKLFCRQKKKPRPLNLIFGQRGGGNCIRTEAKVINLDSRSGRQFLVDAHQIQVYFLSAASGDGRRPLLQARSGPPAKIHDNGCIQAVDKNNFGVLKHFILFKTSAWDAAFLST